MPEAGQKVGSYELVRSLGAGPFGEVWLARHLERGEERAVKIATDPDYIARLRKEDKGAFGLRHANVAAMVALNLTSDPPYFVMEYVEGEDLRRRLKTRSKLPVDETVRIVSQVLEALKAAHAQGIIHRDLKPENILVTPEGSAKVTDFGLGKVQAEIAQSIILAGGMKTAGGKSVFPTFEYMSPEQRAGRPADPRDDLYAVGIIACELLTGRRPSVCGVARSLKRAAVPEPIADVIDRACDEFDYRYASAAEMLAAVASPKDRGRARPKATRRPAEEPAQPATQRARPARPKPKAASPEVQDLLDFLDSVDEDEDSGGFTAPPPLPATASAPKTVTSSIGMELALIPPGTFMMGSDKVYPDERPVHQVKITKPFYFGVYLVTQTQYERVMGRNPSCDKGPNRPVERVSRDDAIEFCIKLSRMDGVDYRPPTEAEWEYGCRAGTTSEYCFGDSPGRLGDYAWYEDNDDEATRDIGLKKPNAWGLYDMHGNVYEWTTDWFGPYSANAQVDPRGPRRGEKGVLRGGSYFSSTSFCRSAFRHDSPPSPGSMTDGFRVVRVVG